MLSFLGVALGILILIGGGALLVRGASDIAAHFGVSPMIIGLTIVGFGTSSPELVVNLVGAFQGATELAFGNVVGSNISNLALILGIAAMLNPIAIQGSVVRRELPLLLLAMTILTVLVLDGPLEGRAARLGRADSIVLLLLFCIFVYITVLDFLRSRDEGAILDHLGEIPRFVSPNTARLRWLSVLGGFALLFVGGELTVRSGVNLATQLGVSTTVVGLFVVAIGTSMPELVTSIIAALRRESDLALGNVIGSNIFNTLVVMPAGGLVATIQVPQGGFGDLVVSWLLTVVLIPIFFLGKAYLGRVAGLGLIAVYVGYAVYRVIQA